MINKLLPTGSCAAGCLVVSLTCAPVAQLDRANASGALGREFESLRAHQTDFPANEASQLIKIDPPDCTSVLTPGIPGTHSREFVVKDCDGRLLAFGSNLGAGS